MTRSEGVSGEPFLVPFCRLNLWEVRLFVLTHAFGERILFLEKACDWSEFESPFWKRWVPAQTKIQSIIIKIDCVGQMCTGPVCVGWNQILFSSNDIQININFFDFWLIFWLSPFKWSYHTIRDCSWANLHIQQICQVDLALAQNADNISSNSITLVASLCCCSPGLIHTCTHCPSVAPFYTQFPVLPAK